MEKYLNLMMSTLSTPFVYFNKIKTDNSKTEDAFNEGVEFMNKGNFDKAVDKFYGAYKEDEKSFECLNNAAAILNSFGRVQESYKLFQHGIAKYPKNPQLRYNYGTLLFMSNSFAEAKNQLEQAFTLDSKSVPVLNNYALVNFSMREFEKAENLISKSIELNDKFEIAYHNMAHVFMTKNDFEKAKEYFEKAVSLNEKNAITLNDLACCYCNLGKIEEAKELFKKSVSLDKNFKNPYFNYGYLALTKDEASDMEIDSGV